MPRPWSTRRPRRAAHSVSNQAADAPQLIEMIEATETNLSAAGVEENPDTFIADAGYFSEKNVNEATQAGVDVLIATVRIKQDERVPARQRPHPQRRHGQGEDGAPAAHQKRAGRLRQTQGHRRTGLRPDEGPTTGRFPPPRGLEGAQGEWALHSLCHNLRKLAQAGA